MADAGWRTTYGCAGGARAPVRGLSVPKEDANFIDHGFLRFAAAVLHSRVFLNAGKRRAFRRPHSAIAGHEARDGGTCRNRNGCRERTHGIWFGVSIGGA